jgi:hypothetical protein
MAAKAYDSDKLIDTKQKLTEHWNEVHIAITKRLGRDAEWHKSEKNTGWNGDTMNI